MFKQLRNKFLLLNIMIITILQIAAFSGIYIFTCNRINHNLDNRLSRALEDFIRRDSENTYKNPPVIPESGFVPEPVKQVNWIISLRTASNGDVIEKNTAF